MTVESLIALIPALPLAGFLFAVLVGARIDRIPGHGHESHGAGHGDESHDAHAEVDQYADLKE